MKQLRGRRILVTRTADQAGPLLRALTRAGADAVHIPLIRIEPLGSTPEVEEALAWLRPGDWIASTSANATRRLLELCAGVLPPGVGAAVIGPASAAPLLAAGIPPALISPAANAASLAQSMIAAGAGHARVLLPQAEAPLPTLSEALAAAGADVRSLPLYRTTADVSGHEALCALLHSGTLDAIVLASPSAARALARVLPPGSSPASIRIACTGPATASTVREMGYSLIVVSTDPAPESVVAALSTALAER